MMREHDTRAIVPSIEKANMGERTIFANLYWIKAPNGLFWYAVDYLRRLHNVRVVICRNVLSGIAKKQLPGIEVVEVDLAGAALRLAKAAAAGEFIYCPTPHPIPFARRQLVVLHDLFPFQDPRRGRLKERLFRLGARLSGCSVGYINHSVGLAFLRRVRIPERRCLYAPNTIDASQILSRRPVSPLPGRIRIGLMGSDSPKKNYRKLFAAVREAGLADRFEFAVYGYPTPYTRQLEAESDGIHWSIVNSSTTPLATFVGSADYLMSLSIDEGFGRPLAFGISQGVPAFVIRSPVSEEFYAGVATLFDDITQVLRDIDLNPPCLSSGVDAGALHRRFDDSGAQAIATINASASSPVA